MKRVKTLALCLLALALVLALAGCGKSTLPGSYRIELDASSVMNTAMAQLGLSEEDLADVPLNIPYTLTLNEDGTFTMVADKEGIASSLQSYLQGSTKAIEEVLYKSAEESGMSREDFDTAFEQSTGSTVSDYVASLIDQLQEEDLTSAFEDEDESGVYKAADGKLYFEAQASDFSDDNYVSYTLEGDKLTFTSVTGDTLNLQALSEMMGDLFPMVFTKQ